MAPYGNVLILPQVAMEVDLVVAVAMEVAQEDDATKQFDRLVLEMVQCTLPVLRVKCD